MREDDDGPSRPFVSKWTTMVMAVCLCAIAVALMTVYASHVTSESKRHHNQDRKTIMDNKIQIRALTSRSDDQDAEIQGLRDEFTRRGIPIPTNLPGVTVVIPATSSTTTATTRPTSTTTSATTTTTTTKSTTSTTTPPNSSTTGSTSSSTILPCLINCQK